jgi:hypothetical protein
MIHADDVKRACVRGAVVGLANALAAAVGSQLAEKVIPVVVSTFLSDNPFTYVSIHVPLGAAAVFGLFVGLLAAPVALAELSLSRSERKAGFGTAIGLLLGIAAIVALAVLQAVYTAALVEGRSTALATKSVEAQIRSDEAIGWALACLAGAVPVTATTLLRIHAQGLGRQLLVTLLATACLAMPVLAFLHEAPDNMVPVHALGAWIFTTALTLGPLASLADRISARAWREK